MPRRSHPALHVLLPILGLLLVPVPGAGADTDWPQWGGPDQTHKIAPGLGLGEAPAVALELAWQRALGSGYSAVVVADGIALTAAAQGDGDYLEAFDPATGVTRWRQRLGPVFLGRSGSDDGPLSTPAVDHGVAFMIHGAGAVVAVRLGDGQVVWRKHLVDDLDASMPRYGFSPAPLVAAAGPAAKVVVVPLGRRGEATLAGLDTRDGSLRWRAGDDALGYQNPVLLALAGRRQVVIAGNESIWSVDPADGAVLWRHPLGFSEDTGLIVPIDDRRFLYTGAGDRTFLVRVETEGDSWRLERGWQERVLKNNHCTPIYHQGHLYGFDGRFLSCVRAEDGELVWKSRPPGGQTLSLVDDHLFLWDAGGAVVAVEATPDGYRERGRLALGRQARVFTPPTFGAGMLLLRDLTSLYALRVAPGRPAAGDGRVAAAEPAGGRDAIDTLLAALPEQAPHQRRAAIDRLLAEHPRLPIVTAAGRVHFLYLGDAPDLAIQGDMTGRWPEQPMTRIAGTDLFHRAYDLAPNERWEYRFKVFDEARLDPANPRRIEGPDGAFSVVVRGTWPEPADHQPAAPDHRGRLVAAEVEDPASDQRYAYRVYTPRGYDRDPDRRYPLAIFSLGQAAIEHGRTVEILDQRSGVDFEPLVAVFLELPASTWWDQNRARYQSIMTELILPAVERDYRLRPGASWRALISREWSSESATLLTLAHPGRIGKLALQSPLFSATFLDRELTPRLAGHPALQLYVDWGRYDGFNPAWPADVREGAPALAERVRRAGRTVTVAHRPGGFNWTSWRTHTASMLGALFPAEGSDESR